MPFLFANVYYMINTEGNSTLSLLKDIIHAWLLCWIWYPLLKTCSLLYVDFDYPKKGLSYYYFMYVQLFFKRLLYYIIMHTASYVVENVDIPHHSITRSNVRNSFFFYFFLFFSFKNLLIYNYLIMIGYGDMFLVINLTNKKKINFSKTSSAAFLAAQNDFIVSLSLKNHKFRFLST